MNRYRSSINTTAHHNRLLYIVDNDYLSYYLTIKQTIMKIKIGISRNDDYTEKRLAAFIEAYLIDGTITEHYSMEGEHELHIECFFRYEYGAIVRFAIDTCRFKYIYLEDKDVIRTL